MQQELLLKARREWCLAALSAIQRLEWFRQNYPDGEAVFPHHQIASWLGMTAVSFSRARQQLS